jgi:hypothetical protein
VCLILHYILNSSNDESKLEELRDNTTIVKNIQRITKEHEGESDLTTKV